VERPEIGCMNLTRKLIKMVDLRLYHYLAGEKLDTVSRLHRVHSIEELALDHNGHRHFDPTKKSVISPCC